MKVRSRYPTNVEKRAGDRQRQYQGPHELHDFKPTLRVDTIVREPKGPGNFILNNPRLRGTSRFEGAVRGMGTSLKKIHFRKKSTWGRIAAVSEIREEVPEAKFALGATLPPPRLP